VTLAEKVGDALRTINKAAEDIDKALSDAARALDDEVESVEHEMEDIPPGTVWLDPADEVALKMMADVAQAKDEDDQTARVLRWIEKIRREAIEACAQLCEQRAVGHEYTKRASPDAYRHDLEYKAREADKCAAHIREEVRTS
jgi:hypothetical protein